MCAAWKKKNERNEIVCFYCTQSDIFLCGIARFSWANKDKLRTFQPQKWKKLRTASLKQNLLVLIKKKECNQGFIQTVSQMFLFKRRLSYISSKTITKLSYSEGGGSGGTANFRAGPWRSPSGQSRRKTSGFLQLEDK